MLSGPPVTAAVSPAALLDRFQAGNDRQRRSLLAQVLRRSGELLPLIPDHLATVDPSGDDWAAGVLIQLLVGSAPDAREAFLASHPGGWLATGSDDALALLSLQRHLMLQEFEQADRLTSALLRELAGAGAVKRGYVYYSEVPSLPTTTLDSLDRLWVCYSRGRFGFSVQARLLAALDGRWEKLWPRLGWKQDGRWTRYPGSFQWSIDAPEGHMPLVNQLRGVRLMAALLAHPAVQRRSGP